MSILAFLGASLIFLIPSAVIALIVTAAINKEKGNDASKFANGVKTVYTYIIVIATLIMIISGTIVAVNSLLDYFLPESEMEYDCTDYYSYKYCEMTTKELRVQNEKNEGITEFASSITLIIISVPLFIMNSKEAKKLIAEKGKNK